MKKIKHYPEVYFISLGNQNLTFKHFKTYELAEKYAKKIGYIEYKINRMYLMTK